MRLGWGRHQIGTISAEHAHMSILAACTLLFISFCPSVCYLFGCQYQCLFGLSLACLGKSVSLIEFHAPLIC